MTTILLTKGTLVCPVFQVVRRVDTHLLSDSKDQVPFLDISIPERFRVTEVLLLTDEDGVTRIFLKGLAVILRDSHRLHLALSCRGIESNHLVVLLIHHT